MEKQDSGSILKSNSTRKIDKASKLNVVPSSLPFQLQHDDMQARHERQDSNESAMLKLDAVKLHYEVHAYVGEMTTMPWLSPMWITLLEDGKFMLHSGEDPLNNSVVSNFLSDMDNVTISDSLW